MSLARKILLIGQARENISLLAHLKYYSQTLGQVGYYFEEPVQTVVFSKSLDDFGEAGYPYFWFTKQRDRPEEPFDTSMVTGCTVGKYFKNCTPNDGKRGSIVVALLINWLKFELIRSNGFSLIFLARFIIS